MYTKFSIYYLLAQLACITNWLSWYYIPPKTVNLIKWESLSCFIYNYPVYIVGSQYFRLIKENIYEKAHLGIFKKQIKVNQLQRRRGEFHLETLQGGCLESLITCFMCKNMDMMKEDLDSSIWR